MATTFRPRRLSAENTAENRDHEFGALKTQWSAAARKSARMPFGALDPNSSVSYPGGAGVKKARKAVVKKPFVKPPPLDAELLVGADPLPGLRSPGKAPPRRASLAPAAARAHAERRARGDGDAQPGRADAAHGGDARGADAGGRADAQGREPGVVRVDARRGVADREGADAHGTVADPASAGAPRQARWPSRPPRSARSKSANRRRSKRRRRCRRTSLRRPTSRRPTRRSRAWRPSSRPRSGRQRPAGDARTSSPDPGPRQPHSKDAPVATPQKAGLFTAPPNTPADRCDAVVARGAAPRRAHDAPATFRGKRRGVAANPGPRPRPPGGPTHKPYEFRESRFVRPEEAIGAKVETPRGPTFAPWAPTPPPPSEKAPPTGWRGASPDLRVARAEAALEAEALRREHAEQQLAKERAAREALAEAANKCDVASPRRRARPRQRARMWQKLL